MKINRTTIAIAAAFCFLLTASAIAQSNPPTVLDQLGPDTSLKYLTKVSEIPTSVIEVMTNILRTGSLKMADKSGDWNATDVVIDENLPFRRLIWAVETQKHFVIHYEKGGIAHNTHFLVISPPNANGKRKLEWAAASVRAKALNNLKEFLAAAKSGKLYSNDYLIH